MRQLTTIVTEYQNAPVDNNCDWVPECASWQQFWLSTRMRQLTTILTEYQNAPVDNNSDWVPECASWQQFWLSTRMRQLTTILTEYQNAPVDTNCDWVPECASWSKVVVASSSSSLLWMWSAMFCNITTLVTALWINENLYMVHKSFHTGQTLTLPRVFTLPDTHRAYI